jgi:hypothetical protein
MKTNPFAALIAVILALGAVACPRAFSQSTNLAIPFGKLSAFPTMVQSGTKPDLTWNISYPLTVADCVTISSQGNITPNRNLLCDVRVIGAGGTTVDDKGRLVHVETVAQIRYNAASSWLKIFEGTNNDALVQQQAIVKSFTATMNQPVDFGGYYINNGVKSLTYSSLSGDHVRSQVNGDTPPSNIPNYNSPSLASFIKPYLDASGKVKIGPMDVIVFMELTHTNKSSPGYDLQDLVLLVTFRAP